MPFDPQFANAISGIESGGRYGLLGPVTRSGDRAYGKYQVMGANVPAWTERFYGHSLTPQQFLANQPAQDAVFQGKFGQYADKYGPEGAARAWFAGEGGMNNLAAKDQLGTTVASYAHQFTNGLGPQYADLNAPPLTPGSPAPALPPPINVGQPPQVAAAQPYGPALTGPQPPQQAQQQRVPQALIAALMNPPGSQIDQKAIPQMPQNPAAQMALSMPPPNTAALQALLAKAPALRGLLV